MGHKLSGFFFVRGSKKMDMIYCNFNSNKNGKIIKIVRHILIVLVIDLILLCSDKQKWIGFADVKSTPVHFYVQRNSSFHSESTPIPFDFARVNEGNAMNLTSGKFMAPRPGIYFFSFTGLARISSSSPSYFSSYLYLNGGLIGISRVDEGKSIISQMSPLTLQATLNLKKGDQVWMTMDHSGNTSDFYLHEDSDHNTHFMGFMLEEENAASL
jgi:hypothetical protein